MHINTNWHISFYAGSANILIFKSKQIMKEMLQHAFINKRNIKEILVKACMFLDEHRGVKDKRKNFWSASRYLFLTFFITYFLRINFNCAAGKYHVSAFL